MRDILKPGLVLLLVTVIAAACLGGMNYLTADVILQNEAMAKAKEMQKVFPGYENLVFENDIETGEKHGVINYTTTKLSDAVGYVFSVRTKGYGGDLDVLVGLDEAGSVLGVRIAKNKETPGLGTNATEPYFLDQYVGKTGGITVTRSATPYNDQEISAITAATITSNAVTDAVNEAIAFYNDNMKGGSK